MDSKLFGIPYHNDKENKSFRRLLVLPTKTKEHLSSGGILIPQDTTKICEEGAIVSVCPGSEFKEGDIIVYQKIQRQNKDEYDSVIVEGEELDSIFENEVWAVNDEPVNRLFVRPLSAYDVGTDKLIIPNEVQGVPERGKIIAAPPTSSFKAGDEIEYRRNEQAIFPTVTYKEEVLEVLFERDVFTVNGAVSPHRIVVKIDVTMQTLKRSSQHVRKGLMVSPLFAYMLHNLQYGPVLGIGEEAKKIYPELNVGDIAIIHHTIEAQPYRILKQRMGKKHGGVISEHRLINAFKAEEREIFGKVTSRGNDASGKKAYKMEPFGKNIFLDWKIEMYHEPEETISTIIDFDFSLNKCHDIDDLRNTISHQKQKAVDGYKMKYNSLIRELEKINPEVNSQRDTGDWIEAKIRELQSEAQMRAMFVNQNHLVKCRIMDSDEYVITTYKELYPINILGTKFLIAHKDLIIATMHSTTITPWGNLVVIKPIEEETAGDLIIPETAKEQPQKGTLISTGDKFEGPGEAGDTVLFKRQMGYEILIEGERHLVMRQNDVLATINVAKN